MLVDDFRIPSIEIDVQGYVQIAGILPVRPTGNGTGDLLPLAYGYRIVQVKYRLLPVRVLGKRGRGEPQRLPHAREGAFEVRHEAMHAIAPMGA